MSSTLAKQMQIPILNFAISPVKAAIALEFSYFASFLSFAFFDGGDSQLETVRDLAQIVGYGAMAIFSIIGCILAGWLLYRSKSNQYLKEDGDNLRKLLDSTKLLMAEKDLALQHITLRRDTLREELIEKEEEVLRLKAELKKPK